MKIIVAHYKYYIQGGPEKYMFKFMKLAEQNHCQVIPFSIDYNNNIDSEYKKYFASSGGASRSEYSANRHNPLYLFRAARQEFHNADARKKLRKLITDIKPDILYVLIPGALTPDIFEVASKMGVRVILRLSDFRVLCGTFNFLRNGQICEECKYGKYSCMIKHRCLKNSFMFSFIRAMALYYHRKRNSYRYVDAVIAPPEFTAKKIIESGFFPEEKVFINPTFIDCKDIKIKHSHTNTVLCMGRFSESKGFVYVVKSLTYLKDIDVTVAITGNAEDCDEEVKKYLVKPEIKDRVVFTGFKSGKELDDLIDNSLCIASPAIWYENLPNVVLEAFAHGKPVIASNIGSLADVVQDNVNGYLFEPKNEKEIAQCIRKLIENENNYFEMCQNARDICETIYSPQAHWERFTEIVNKIK